MGRKRRHADQWMPPRVYRGRSAYEYHPKGGGNIRLCPLESDQAAVWAAYTAARAKHAADAQRGKTFGDIIDLYFASSEFRERPASTQTDYRQSAGMLRKVFGQARDGAITPVILRQYMDRRGEKSRIRANRERSFLSIVWAWAFERGHLKTRNPVPDVKPFREKARDRYVTDAEYLAVYRRAPASVRTAMELAYLCAARQADILALRWGRKGQTGPDKGQTAVVLEQGVYIKQGKTGTPQIKLWTTRLRRALHRASINQGGTVASLYVVHTRTGQRYTRTGFESVWMRARAKALADGAIAETFTFHDLKAKSISDYAGDQQRFSGHKSAAQLRTYIRTPASVTALDPGKKSDP